MRSFMLVALFIFYPLVGSESGTAIVIEGSSTVYPITVAVSERVAQESPQVVCQVVCSGSSAGLKRLIAGEIPIADASRPINHDEIATAAAHGIEFIELPVALDAITFVVNTKNTFVTSLTVEELRKLWQPNSTITTWAQVRQGWPEAPIELYSMGKESGTFDFMTEAIVGKARSIRSDLAGTSQDPQQLIQGIVTHDQAIGYFGHAYFRQNAAMLRAVPIDDGSGPVMPSTESIVNRTYRPLSRPIFIYINKAELAKRSEIATLIASYLRLAPQLVPQVGYVPLLEHSYDLVRQRFANRVTGSAFSSARAEDRLDDVLTAGTAKGAAVAAATELPAAAPTVKAALAVAAAAPAARTAAPSASVAASAAPAPAAPAAANTHAPAATDNPWLPSSHPSEESAHVTADPGTTDDLLRTLDRLRSASLDLARLSLDDATMIAELERHELAVRTELARISARAQHLSLPACRQPTVADLTLYGATAPVPDQGFPMVIGHVELTDCAQGIVDAQQLDSFKQAALGITDPDQRRRLIMALRNPSSANVSNFAEVVARLGQGRGDANLILCYARGGLVVR